jgi:4-hydroxy-3-polyprenylbenzoate decarboxylase
VNLILAVTGATGAYAAELLTRMSPWPITLLCSHWGRTVYERECGPFDALRKLAHTCYDNADLSAPISSGSTPTRGMVILPCSANAMAKVAAGIGDSLIARAAHCHLKERRRLILCSRESPWGLIDLDNARTIAAAGGIVMPMCPPFYMAGNRRADDVTAAELLKAYVERVLALLGRPAEETWESAR